MQEKSNKNQKSLAREIVGKNQNHFFYAERINVCLCLVLFLSVFLFSSCHKKEEETKTHYGVNYGAKGIYVLCEGSYNMNNSVITYFDCSNGMVTPDIFTKVNGRGLGDSGNDLQLYGTKLYCVVNISERVEVMDAKTCKSLKAIALSGKQPRRVAFSEAYAYVSCYDGDVVKIDTATLSVVSSVYSGLNPDGICVSNGKLYVANSGGLNWESGYNNTVSVFSLPEMSRLKDITVVCNPTLLAADQQGDVYLMSSGNWNDIPMTLQRIDSKCDTVAQTFDFAVGNISIVGNLMYMYSYNWTTASSEYHILNLITEQVVSTHIISDGTKIQMPYGIYSNIVNGDIYICDTYNATVTGDCFCFDKNGKKKFEFETGINPSKIVILN